MLVCPNCSHQNPDGAIQCEACYTPLPTMTACPSCGAAVQSDASFCGQCGFDLRTVSQAPLPAPLPPLPDPISVPEISVPSLPQPEPLVPPEPLELSAAESLSFAATLPEVSAAEIAQAAAEASNLAPTPNTPSAGAPVTQNPSTQLQVIKVQLLHLQTSALIELPPNTPMIHIGKPNDRIPPDLDVSGFPNSEIVSRVHAAIRVEGDVYYIEDVGSSNGTYVNNMPLPFGNRHRLRTGDRISLGKGDKVTFIFQSA